MNRRNFLRQSALAGMATLGSPYLVQRRSAKYKTVLIGSGWWGMNILREAVRSGAVQVTGLCDPDENQLASTSTELQTLCNDRPRRYKDYRECLRREKPDIAIIATPDHWHALNAIEAMKSGAHVFLEKPISHTLKEGSAIQRTARDTQRICIVDFHRRYSPHNLSGMDFLKSGKAGQIKEVKAFVNYRWGMSQPNAPAEVPVGLDWDLYCGPSNPVPYSPNIHPRGWRQYSAFGNGQLGDWGPHWFDQILWWTEEKAPRSVFSLTSSPSILGSSMDTPESQVVVFEFEGFNCTWEHSMLNGRPQQQGESVGVHFYGTEGTFHLGWQQGWAFYPHDSKKEIIRQPAQLEEPDQQNIRLVWQDFLRSIESGKLPAADIEQGRQATNMALLGMLSARLGRSVRWNHEKDVVEGDEAANALLRRDYRGEWVYPE